MKGTVKIGTQELGMLANAASPVIYKNIFHEDFLKKCQSFEGDQDSELFQKMGFVMWKQAQGLSIRELMSEITIDEYYEWLVQFEPLDIMMASADIANLYYAQEAGGSIPKKEGA